VDAIEQPAALQHCVKAGDGARFGFRLGAHHAVENGALLLDFRIGDDQLE